jgi:hypothetical protein
MFNYFTVWSLLISYSIFIWTIFLYIPKWLFLFAACFLTTTSIMGTFFITIPGADNRASEKNMTTQKVIIEDAFIHSGPLILFLLLFGIISKKVVDSKPRTIELTKNIKFSVQDHHKVILLSVLIIISYLGYIKFEKIYFYDYFTLIILSACVFVTSYQIYSSIKS